MLTFQSTHTISEETNNYNNSLELKTLLLPLSL